MKRRCVVCTRPMSEHTPSRLVAHGYRWHSFDPGERRKGRERRARRVVWTDARRQKAAA